MFPPICRTLDKLHGKDDKVVNCKGTAEDCHKKQRFKEKEQRRTVTKNNVLKKRNSGGLSQKTTF